MIENGQNWTRTTDLNIAIFRVAGVKGKNVWRLNDAEIQPKPGSDYIIPVLRRITRDVPSARIVRVKVSPEVGVLLYFQENGGLTLEHLKSRRTTEDHDTITCEDVEIGGGLYALTIQRDLPPWVVHVVDNRGNIFS